MSIEDFIDKLIKREQQNDDAETKYGISKTTAKLYGFCGDISELPLETAKDIYRIQYWIDPAFDKIALIDDAIAEILLNYGVLIGQMTTTNTLRRVLNVLNHNGKDYSELAKYGKIDILVIKALENFIKKHGTDGKKVVRGMMASRLSVHLLESMERKIKNEEFEYNWQLNRVLGVCL